MASIREPDFDESRDQPGFSCRRARLGRQAGSEKLGMSLWELPPGEAAYPYHWHVAEEELIAVLEGRPSLRTPDGWRQLDEGEVVSFRVGEEGAHQVANRTQATVRFLSISNQQPDVVFYPDSDKVAFYERLPDRTGRREIFRRGEAAADYWEGESPP